MAAKKTNNSKNLLTFLLEVGTEELPASFVSSAIEQWRSRIPLSLSEHHLTPAQVKVYGTPRRLAVLIEGLPAQQPDREVESKGPAVAAAFVNGDVQGQLTKAALGFAKSKGVEPSTLFVQETDKGAFVFAKQQITGQPAAGILAEIALAWITGLEGKRLMRWGSGDLRFPRPIRWLVALLDDKILPLSLENLHSDRITQGHRVLHPQPVSIDTAANYVSALQAANVMVDAKTRQATICNQINGVAELMRSQPEIPSDLLEEVTQLVEWPTAVVGEFEREFLELPVEVIKTEMVSHQRYFPMHALSNSESDRSSESSSQNIGQLLPYFITISNGDPDRSKLIAAGNGRVIRARLADGKFFYEADRARSLESYLPELDKVTFQAQLGSVATKADRIRQAAKAIVKAISNLKITKADSDLIDRAAQLCKADLVTQMVKEFPELQGVMGRYYAQSSGESTEVATAILEHYLPKGAGDTLPQTLTGQIVAIADRIDTLFGIFGLGIIPTGSSDPFALRRAATGIVQIAWDGNYALDIPQLLASMTSIYQAQIELPQANEQILANLYKWFEQRIRTLLQEHNGIDYDLVDAVFGMDDDDYAVDALRNLSRTRDRALFLQQARQSGTMADVYEVVNRASRLATQGILSKEVTEIQSVVDASTLGVSAEQELYQAIAALPSNPSFEQLWQSLEAIAPVLAKFFDDVLVMDEDLRIRQNRLNMLGVIRNYSRILADFSAMRPA
jgi:glycyl-tRNA synthetase beta chain